MSRPIAVVLLVVLAAAGAAQEPTLEGDWDFVSASEDGKALPAAMIAEHMMRGTKTTIAMWSHVEKKEIPGSKLDYKILAGKNLDVSQKLPKKGSKDEFITVTKRGIFELKGDTLKLSWFEVPKESRPANFDGGPGLFAAVLKRKAK